MFTARIGHEDLCSRLDSAFYSPQYLAAERKLRTVGCTTLRTLVKGIECGPFGGNAIAENLYTEQGVAFVRPVNLSQNFFDEASLVFVPKDRLISSELKIYSGTNLYFGRVGFPCVGILDIEASISPNVVIAIADSAKADTHYLYAFCASRYGLDQLRRQLKEVAQPTTSTDAVRGLLVIKLDRRAQEYIGNKVRQAERLRAWAKALSRVAPAVVEALLSGTLSEQEVTHAQQSLERGDATPERAMLASVGTKSPHLQAASNISRVAASALEHRLDARYNSPHAVSIRQRIKALGLPVERVSVLLELSCGPFGSTLTSDEHDPNGDVLLIQPTNISGDTFDDAKSWRIRSEDLDEKGLRIYGPETLLFARVGVYPHVGVLPQRAGTATISSSMIAGESNGGIDPYYLFAFFRSPSGYQLLLAAQKITAQPTIGTEEIGATSVFVPGEPTQRYVGDKARTGDEASVLARCLTTAAKLLVEALIEGQLTEADLIAAQQALEAGDDGPDRAILARLTADGLDGSGSPLFPDLDRLATLLARAASEVAGDAN